MTENVTEFQPITVLPTVQIVEYLNSTVARFRRMIAKAPGSVNRNDVNVAKERLADAFTLVMAFSYSIDWTFLYGDTGIDKIESELKASYVSMVGDTLKEDEYKLPIKVLQQLSNQFIGMYLTDAGHEGVSSSVDRLYSFKLAVCSNYALANDALKLGTNNALLDDSSTQGYALVTKLPMWAFMLLCIQTYWLPNQE